MAFLFRENRRHGTYVLRSKGQGYWDICKAPWESGNEDP